MSLLRIRLAAGALVGAFVAGETAAAHAHAVCGDRIFPDSIGKPIFSQSLPMFTGARQ